MTQHGRLKRAIFLDRDGVINRALVRDGLPYPPSDLHELEILPGVFAALAALRAAGYLLIVVTNQPDVARGTQRQSAVEGIHLRLARELPLDEFRVCYHDDADACECRKPKPGALLEAARLHDIDLARSYMIGDRWRDTEAGIRAGCKVVFVDHGYLEKRPEKFDHCVASLEQAARFILSAGERT